MLRYEFYKLLGEAPFNSAVNQPSLMQHRNISGNVIVCEYVLYLSTPPVDSIAAAQRG